MKIVFGIDQTEDRSNSVFDGDVFIEKTVDEGQKKLLEEIRKKTAADERAQATPRWVMYLRTAMSAVFFVCAFVLARRAMDTSFTEMIKDRLWLFILGVVSALSYVGISVYEIKRRNRTVRDTDDGELKRMMQDAESRSYAMLGVPDSSPEADVLAAVYRLEGDRIIQGNRLYSFINMVFRIFRDDRYMYLANYENLYRFPLKDMSGIVRFEGKVTVPNWTKDVSFEEPPFDQYKIGSIRDGSIYYESNYALRIKKGTELYILNFPPYELPVFEEMSGRKYGK